MIPFSTFVRVYLRSFFIQGSFSIKFRQNVGFAFCMDPVGKVLWTENEDRRAFLNRHLEYYNGNPFMITLVLGAIAGLEEHYKNDDGITERDINGFKRAVGAATGSVGDRIVGGIAVRSVGGGDGACAVQRSEPHTQVVLAEKGLSPRHRCSD